MTQLDSTNRSITLPFKAGSDIKAVRRLLVLVPSSDADLAAVTRRIWELADSTGAHIKFLGLCNDTLQELSLRRTLITMSAIVNYDNVSAETEVVFGRNWVEAVKSRWQPGDLVVCFEEQRYGVLQKPLGQILRSDLDVHLYILSGLYPETDAHPNRLAKVAMWIGFLAIILAFFVIQVKIYQLENDWTALWMVLVIAFELLLIWIWNNLFG